MTYDDAIESIDDETGEITVQYEDCWQFRTSASRPASAERWTATVWLESSDYDSSIATTLWESPDTFDDASDADDAAFAALTAALRTLLNVATVVAEAGDEWRS